MIEQSGQVSRVEGSAAWITCRPAQCRACMEGRGCGAGVFTALQNRRCSTIRVSDAAGLRPGEQVVLGLDERRLLAAAARLYGLPLLGLIGGVLAGALAGGAANDTAVLIGALAGLAVSLLFQGRDRGRLPRPVVLRHSPGGRD